MKTARRILGVIRGIFLTYAVLFSLFGTVAIIAAAFFVLSPVHQVKYLQKNNPRQTSFMASYRDVLHKAKKADTLFQSFVPLDSIPLSLQRAVIAAEDDGFYTHPGFDLVAMLEALQYNQAMNRNVRGASTITQQLAKNLFLSSERSFLRKYLELAYTLLLETYLGKKRILELYLNYAQWGTDVFGCEAAARRYFHKSCRSLSFIESARLAATLAMPCKTSPTAPNSTFIGNRFAVMAANMYRRKQIDTAIYFTMTGTYPADSNNTPAQDSSAGRVRSSDAIPDPNDPESAPGTTSGLR